MKEHAKTLGLPVPDYDGVSEFWLESIDDWLAMSADHEGMQKGFRKTRAASPNLVSLPIFSFPTDRKLTNVHTFCRQRIWPTFACRQSGWLSGSTMPSRSSGTAPEMRKSAYLAIHLELEINSSLHGSRCA